MTKKPAKSNATVTASAVPGPNMAYLLSAIEDEPVNVPDPGVLGRGSLPSAITNAVRKGKSSVVVLGLDKDVTQKAEDASRIKGKIADLAAQYAKFETELRDYGAKMRGVYNETFKTSITTVNVPFVVKSDGKEDAVLHVQVVCSNKYSVAQDSVIGGKESALKGWYDKLFVTDKKKVLRKDAEDLFRGILKDQGLDEAKVEKAMNLLFEEKTTVTTVEAYEEEEKKAPEEVRIFLSQAVTRNQPSLRFPDIPESAP